MANFVSNDNATSLINAINSKKDTKPVEITYDEWIALTDDERAGTHYLITDVPAQSGGGHVIENTSGTDMPQEDNLQFVGVYSEDDSTNNRTKVNIVRDMTKAQMDALSSAEKEGFIHVTDEPDNPYNGDVSDAEITFTEASSRANIASGEKLSILFGKIKKWFSDLASMFVAKTGDTMTGVLEIKPTTTANTLLRVAKVHTSTTNAPSDLVIGNNIPDGTAGASNGRILLYGLGRYYALISAENVTTTRDFRFPDKSGTLATTSDIPTDFVSKASGGTFGGNVIVDRADGTTSSTGSSDLVVGNNIASGTAGNSRGHVSIYGASTYFGRLRTGELTTHRYYDLPNKNGTVAMTSDISSKKFKENISPLSAEEANKILDVEVVTFDYKDGVCGEDERYNNRGVIAEQVEPIISYVVEHSTEEDGEVLRVDYRKFIPYLIKMVQNQQTEIDNLKAEIERIKEAK